METKKHLLVTLIIVAISATIIIAGCKKQQNGKNKPPIVLPDSTMFVSTDSLITNSNGFFNKTIIYLLDAAKGSLVATYTYPPDAKSNWCIPLVGNGFLYAVENDKINAININTGTILWTDSVNNDATPILHNDTFYGVNFAPGSTYVYALDATKQSNTFLWKYQEGTNGFQYTVNYYSGIVYVSKFTNSGGSLTALDAKTGTLKWTTNGPYSVSSINNGIIIAGNTIIDAVSGSQITTVPASLITIPPYSIIYATQNLFFTSSSNSQLIVNAYNITNDALKWTLNEGAISNDTSKSIEQMQTWNSQLIAETNISVYANSAIHTSPINIYNGSNISAFDINTGQQKWNYGANPTSGFLMVNNTLYTGLISAVDLYTGKQKWSKKDLYIFSYDGSVSDICVFASGKAYSLYIQ